MKQRTFKKLFPLITLILLFAFLVTSCVNTDQQMAEKLTYLNEIGEKGSLSNSNNDYDLLDEGFGVISVAIRAEKLEALNGEAKEFYLSATAGIYQLELLETAAGRFYLAHIPNASGSFNVEQIAKSKIRFELQETETVALNQQRATDGIDRVIWQNDGDSDYMALTVSDYSTAKLLGYFDPGNVKYIRTESGLYFTIAHFLNARNNNGGVIADTIDDLEDNYTPATPSGAVENYKIEGGGLVPDPDEDTLQITGVNSITTTAIEVTFTAPGEAKSDMTIDVTDPNGVARSVQAQNISAAQTSATFQFVTALTDIIPGTWTINNYSYIQEARQAVLRMDDLQGGKKVLRHGNTVYTVANSDSRNIEVGWQNNDTETFYIDKFVVMVKDGDGVEVYYKEVTGREIDPGQTQYSTTQITDLSLAAAGDYTVRINVYDSLGAVVSTSNFNLVAGAVVLEDDTATEFYETYMTVTEALADADEDYTITLEADVEDSPTVAISGITLDINGMEIDGSVTVSAEEVEVTGSTITGNFTVDGNIAVTVADSVTIGGNLVLVGCEARILGNPTINGTTIYQDCDETVVYNMTELYEALEDEEPRIRFGDDITTTDTFDDRINYEGIVFNLNGKTLTVDGTITIEENNILFKNGTINTTSNGDFVLDIDTVTPTGPYYGLKVKTTIENVTLNFAGENVKIANSVSSIDNQLYLEGEIRVATTTFDVGSAATDSLLRINGTLRTNNGEKLDFKSGNGDGLVKGNSAVVFSDNSVQLGDAVEKIYFDEITFEAPATPATDLLHLGNVVFNEAIALDGPSTITIANGKTATLREDWELSDNATILTADEPGALTRALTVPLGTLQGYVTIDLNGNDFTPGPNLQLKDLTIDDTNAAPGDFLLDNGEFFLSNVALETEMTVGATSTTDPGTLTLLGDVAVSEDATIVLYSADNAVIDGRGNWISGEGKVEVAATDTVQSPEIKDITISADLDINLPDSLVLSGTVDTYVVTISDDSTITLKAEESDDTTTWSFNDDVTVANTKQATICADGEGESIVDGNGYELDSATITMDTTTDVDSLTVRDTVFVGDVNVVGENIKVENSEFDAEDGAIAVTVSGTDCSFSDVAALDNTNGVVITANGGKVLNLEGNLTGTLNAAGNHLLVVTDSNTAGDALNVAEDGVVIEKVAFTNAGQLALNTEENCDVYFNNIFDTVAGAEITNAQQLVAAFNAMNLGFNSKIWLKTSTQSSYTDITDAVQYYLP